MAQHVVGVREAAAVTCENRYDRSETGHAGRRRLRPMPPDERNRARPLQYSRTPPQPLHIRLAYCTSLWVVLLCAVTCTCVYSRCS